jgi:hypothetical protein
MKALERMIAIVTVAVAGTVALAGAARADEPAAGFAPAAVPGGGFGTAGGWVVSGEANVNVHGSGSSWDLRLQPSLDYFLKPSFSVGGVVTIAHASGGTTNLGLGARAGYNFNFNDHFGVWPLGGFIFAHTSDSGQHTSSSSAALHIFVPFLYHVVPHFFLGFGPSFDQGLSDNHHTFGGDSVVGGWF